MRNPFTLGIVQRDDFCNREREVGELVHHARNGDNVVLFSPRRYGKSSLITKVLEILRKEGYLTVYADLYPIASERDFLSRFSAAIFRGIGHGADSRTVAEKVKNLFSRLVPTLEVKPDGFSISAKFDSSAETGLLLDDLMEGMYAYIKREGLRACIALDEFQEIAELPESKKIEGVLRSHIQFHKEVAYCYVGSRRRILTDMFSNKGGAFYKSAFSYTLREIAREDFVPYIESRFQKTGKTCPRAVAEKLYDAVRGYPYYVQKLASVAWDRTMKRCTADSVQEAYRMLLDMERIDFEGIWDGLALIQKSVLKALANEPTPSPYSREFLERHRLSVGGTQKAMKALLSRDLIERGSENTYRLTDPVMEAWLKG